MARKDDVLVEMIVNGRPVGKWVPARMHLCDFLRDELCLTGTHVGCEHGVCGSCTVLVDGVSVRSCLVFAVQVQGARVETVEGLGTVEKLHPIQEAFWENHGLQCGFCTPGFLMRIKEFLGENPNPTREEAIEAVSGNLCRCTGYQTIVDSVLSAAAKLREAAGGKDG